MAAIAEAPAAGAPPVTFAEPKLAPEAPRAVPHRAPAPMAAHKEAAAPAATGTSLALRAPAAAPLVTQSTSVKAGEWDDNANYREFLRWLGIESHLSFHRVDLGRRQFLVVRDQDGRAIPGCEVAITDKHEHTTRLITASNGRAILFPGAEGLHGGDLVATARCEEGSATRNFSMDQDDGIVDLRLSGSRHLAAERAIDVAFVLDTTGSMSEEIAAVKETIHRVTSSLEGINVRVRIGMVEYKDRGDEYVTRIHPMTTDIRRFAGEVSEVRASGGGDMPESVNAGLHAAVADLEWQRDAVAKLAFLIGDAPPHLDYQQDFDYAADMQRAAHQGIQVFTIAASGMDDVGQVIWRQVAQYTGGTNMFVLRGGAGPQSTGAGDPKSSCGGTQTAYQSGNLDGLILGKVHRALAAIDGDPMRIAGLHSDENAKPCSERLVIAQ
jgi:Mg-chelatase subunit ChlD